MLPLTNRIGVIVAAPEYERIVPSLDLDPVYSEVKSAKIKTEFTYKKPNDTISGGWGTRSYENIDIARLVGQSRHSSCNWRITKKIAMIKKLALHRAVEKQQCRRQHHH